MFPATITITDITEVNFILLFYLVSKTKFFCQFIYFWPRVKFTPEHAAIHQFYLCSVTFSPFLNQRIRFIYEKSVFMKSVKLQSVLAQEI